MNDILGVDIAVTDPTTEPVTLNEAKDWIKIDWVDDDAVVNRLITSCREAIENYTNCSLVEKTVTCTVNLCDYFELPYGPVKGNPTVTQGENTITDYSKVEGQFMKVCGLRGIHKFVYNVGYENVPARLKEAILNEIAYRYQNRGDQSKDLTLGSTYMCEAALHLCQPYKRMAWL